VAAAWWQRQQQHGSGGGVDCKYDMYFNKYDMYSIVGIDKKSYGEGIGITYIYT
jgi:hypothetical protein